MTLPTEYPVRVDDDSPVMHGLTRLEIPDRNPLLPPLFLYKGDHPHHRLRPSDRRTYVYLVDPSPKGKAMAIKIANSMQVPAGPIAGSLYQCACPTYVLITRLIRAPRFTADSAW